MSSDALDLHSLQFVSCAFHQCSEFSMHAARASRIRKVIFLIDPPVEVYEVAQWRRKDSNGFQCAVGAHALKGGDQYKHEFAATLVAGRLDVLDVSFWVELLSSPEYHGIAL